MPRKPKSKAEPSGSFLVRVPREFEPVLEAVMEKSVAVGASVTRGTAIGRALQYLAMAFESQEPTVPLDAYGSIIGRHQFARWRLLFAERLLRLSAGKLYRAVSEALDEAVTWTNAKMDADHPDVAREVGEAIGASVRATIRPQVIEFAERKVQAVAELMVWAGRQSGAAWKGEIEVRRVAEKSVWEIWLGERLLGVVEDGTMSPEDLKRMRQALEGVEGKGEWGPWGRLAADA